MSTVVRRMLGVPLLTTLLIALMVAIGATGAFAGQATASPSPSPSAETLTLRLGWTESPLNLNPFIGYSNSYEVWLLNYDTLVAVGADGAPSKETGLAEDWTLSADEKEWTFTIRKGVTCQTASRSRRTTWPGPSLPSSRTS